MPVPVEKSDKRGDFLIIYGSQTGQSESIAKQLCERAETELKLSPRLFCMDKTEKQFWIEREPLVVIICSSTGDGDAPDNAGKFVRRLCKNTLSNDFLKDTTFALLGLGDSNYSTFQGVPNKLDKQLRHLGATELIPTGHADDQVGLDQVVEPWLEKLYPALLQYFGIDASFLPPVTKTSVVRPREMSSSDSVNPLTNDLSISLNLASDDNAMDCSDSSQGPQEAILKPNQLQYPEDKPCLIRGASKLSQDEALRVPVASVTFLAASVTHTKLDTNEIKWQNGCKLVGTASGIHTVPVVGLIKLTGTKARKEKREIQIDISDTGLEYQPGDAFYFIFPNPRQEVNYILQRLGLLMLADNRLDVVVNPKTEKKNAIVPAHIPPVCTLRYLFTYCLDIRRSPGRPLLRVLADYTSNESEKRRLLELCSSQGVDEFTAFVRQAGLTIADVLHAFPSCLPPVDRLVGTHATADRIIYCRIQSGSRSHTVEGGLQKRTLQLWDKNAQEKQLPRLIPRPYSAACAQSRWKNRVRFVYSLVEQPQGDGRSYARRGLCTDWLSGLKVGDRVPIMLKEAARFRLPQLASSVPMILIGPGSGIAPFLGFLQEIMHEHLGGKNSCLETERWVFFGCRQLDQDFIYRDELEAFERERIITKLVVCESQEGCGSTEAATARLKYVQDALKAQSKEVVDFIMNAKEGGQLSKVFLCGDAVGMSKGVWETFIEIVSTHGGMSEAEAKQYLVKLKEDGRYIEDVWS
uniref:Methionine synthase reductase n=1 Tax=Plectus sambesii TaxID=2011161 RepID=A0A914VIP3_9BILA